MPRLLHGGARDMLREVADGSVHTCITSPPYWNLRDYGCDGQIGLEPTPEEYVAKLVEVFREVRRVLRPDGTFWLNISDSYVGGGGFCPDAPSNIARVSGDQAAWGKMHSWSADRFTSRRSPPRNASNIKAKNLVGIPWMLAHALREDGWYVRAEIIWYKLACPPENVRDRPTRAHETIFLLTSEPRYFYDAAAIAEDAADPEGGTRNCRSVWPILPRPYKGAHFAVFPEEIPERCILAGTSAHGACKGCGTPWSHGEHDDWSPGCSCGDVGVVPCVVLDPFAGSGTTLAVAAELRRDYIGIELNPEYIKLIEQRLVPVNETLAQANNLELFMRDS